MKTRFLISTAVGILFASAAFGQTPGGSATSGPSPNSQSPSTTTPETKNRDAAPSASTPSATPPASNTGPTQAQTNPSSSTSSAPPSSAQSNGPAPSNPQTGQTQTGAGTNSTNSQQSSPSGNASTNAQSSSTNVNASVQINDQQRIRVSESITRLNVQPINNVNFSLTIGTTVPRDIRLQTLPGDVVEIVPQYRGYSFFVVRDEIVIVEPSTYQIVTVLPRSGSARAGSETRKKVTFTDRDRDVVRKHVKTRSDRQTTGSTAKMSIQRGEVIPETVVIEEFPETVYRDAPTLREYRYIHRENRTYLIEPSDRRVIEEID